MFKVIRSIRLLFLLTYSEKLPAAIVYLLHLRYLRFDAGIFPRSIISFYYLQFLINDDDHAYNDNYFPRDMNNLPNLRYLNHRVPGVGNLKLLQELERFSIKNEIGYRIEELEHMNDLRIVEIYNLKELRDAQEASKAKLCDKTKLTELSLRWKHSPFCGVVRKITYPGLDERVLDNLQPHNYLKTLRIQHYMGIRSALWMNEAHLINNLQHIDLIGCLEWKILPPLGQLRFLKTLCLENMPKVKRLEHKFLGNDMTCAFPSLEVLTFKKMEALVDWFDASVVDGLFPCLTELRLFQCPNSQELPYLPPKLETLKIYKIGWKTLNCCTISKSTPLKILEVGDCPNIASISLAGEIGKLEKLTVENLPSLQSLPSSLTNASSLEILMVKKLRKLREFPDLPPSLKELYIKECDPELLELMKYHAPTIFKL